MPARAAGAHRSAFFDKGRCLPWGYQTECIVVRRGLPHLAQGHHFKMETVTGRDGKQKTLKMPFVTWTTAPAVATCETRARWLIAPASA